MGITKSGPKTGKSPVKNKQRCWQCGATSPVFVVSPSSGNSLCKKCAGKYWVGVDEVKKRAQKA